MENTTSQDQNAIALVVEANTGEITSELYPGDRIVRKTSVESYKKNIKKNEKNDNNEEIEFIYWNTKSFYKVNVAELRLWLDDLSQAEKAFLFSIAPYISFDDCHLQYGNGVDIGTEDLIKITQMSRGLVYKTISSLIEKDILYKGKNSKNRQYFVNPWLFCKGNRINKVLKTMFKNYKIRSKGNIEWKDLKDF